MNDHSRVCAIVYRIAEAVLRANNEGVLVEDHRPFDATAQEDPSRYRVNRVGPFEYVTTVAPGPRALSEDMADRLAASCPLPIYVEGSQSPLSVKQPHEGSDVDLLIAARSRAELAAARRLVVRLRTFQVQVPALRFGIVHLGWLRLPNFYSAVLLGARSPDRRWWQADAEQRHAEAIRRMNSALVFLRDGDAVERLLMESITWLGIRPAGIREWRVIPRWLGFEVLPEEIT